MPDSSIDRFHLIHEWPEVRGLEVVVLGSAEAPHSIRLAIVGTPDGWSTVSEIDAADPGARARAISLGEIIHEALQTADLAWSVEA